LAWGAQARDLHAGQADATAAFLRRRHTRQQSLGRASLAPSAAHPSSSVATAAAEPAGTARWGRTIRAVVQVLNL
jgi:hypothetical protein